MSVLKSGDSLVALIERGSQSEIRGCVAGMILCFILGFCVTAQVAGAKCSLPRLEQALALTDSSGDLPWPEAATLSIHDLGDTYGVEVALVLEDGADSTRLLLRSSGNEEEEP